LVCFIWTFWIFLPVPFENNYSKGSSSYHLCVEYFSQFSFDSEMYKISAAGLKQLYNFSTVSRIYIYF
jgi:hypothetical protein